MNKNTNSYEICLFRNFPWFSTFHIPEMLEKISSSESLLNFSSNSDWVCLSLQPVLNCIKIFTVGDMPWWSPWFFLFFAPWFYIIFSFCTIWLLCMYIFYKVCFCSTKKCTMRLVSSFPSLSCVWLFVTPWISALQASLSITISWSSLRLTSIELVMPSSHLIPCRPLFLLAPIPSIIRVFFNESILHMRWPKYWSFSFSIIPSKEHPGLIFRMDWLDLLAVQETLKSLLHHHSSKASILWRSAFFTVQLSVISR